MNNIKLIKLLEPNSDNILKHTSKDIIATYLRNIEYPHWEIKGCIHNWRSYVPDAIKKIWDELSDDAKIMIYYAAEEKSNDEEWE